MTADGLLIVDKPAGLTSHTVVARVRKLAGTRKVGHAGTLDPMATGVLVLGIGRATRLLGHLALHDKDYLATIRLGAGTTTDDAEGELGPVVDATGVSDVAIAAGIASLTGAIEQVPTSVSAIKVDGVRAHAAARAGTPLELKARPVIVAAFDLVRRVDEAPFVDLDVAVTCSTGTYVRALARDLGVALGVGGHLSSLRRTRSGPFALDAARTLEQLAEKFETTSLTDAVAATFARRDLTAEDDANLRHGRPLSATGRPGAVGAFSPPPASEVVALLEDRDGLARPLVVFAPAGQPAAEH